jgi:hypothetical protein
MIIANKESVVSITNVEDGDDIWWWWWQRWKFSWQWEAASEEIEVKEGGMRWVDGERNKGN